MGSDTWKIQTMRVSWEISRLPVYRFSPTVQKVWSLMLSLREGDWEAMTPFLFAIGS